MSQFDGRAMRVMVQMLVFLFTGVVLLLLQPVFLSNAISVSITAIAIGVAVISYFRPHNGLLILAALVPLGPTLGTVLGVRMRESEALVLAFLAGVLLRGWALHQFRDLTLTKLHAAALLFGSVVAASCVAQLRNFETGELGRYATQHYLTSFRGFGMIFSAMLLVEGLALLLYAAHCCRTLPWFPHKLMRALVIGGVAAAAINLLFFLHELIETGAPLASLTGFFLTRRWSAHIGDLNAAGSFFAMIMFMALGVAVTVPRFRWAWGFAGFLLAVALWLTSSRTAITAALIVTVCWIAKMAFERSLSPRRLGIVVLALSVPIVVFAAQYFLVRSNAPPSRAMNIRWLFLETTAHMVAEHPVFGVGIGQYARWSTQYAPPALLKIYIRENAHNNFSQIAGELGVVGLASFIAVLAVCLRPARDSSHPAIAPALAGLAAFIVSWLGGHPLLVPEVAYPFWLTLAIVPGVASNRPAEPDA